LEPELAGRLAFQEACLSSARNCHLDAVSLRQLSRKRSQSQPAAPASQGGSQANDEMGNLWLQILPLKEGDQRKILQEAVVRRLLEKYPEDFAANFNMGDLLLMQEKAAAAVPYFEAAWKAQPGNATAASELGWHCISFAIRRGRTAVSAGARIGSEIH